MQAEELGETVLLSISNVQRYGNFLLSQPSEYLRCLGVTLDGHQCSRVKYRHASDDTWSCQDHPGSNAKRCMPSKVWYHRCGAITPGAPGRCRNSKSTSDEGKARIPWYCKPLHRFPQPQFDYTRSDEDPRNRLAEPGSEVDEAERRNELRARLSELEQVYGDILQRDRTKRDRAAAEHLRRARVEWKDPDAAWRHHRLRGPRSDGGCLATIIWLMLTHLNRYQLGRGGQVQW
ncbi:hypothetical protein FIBSPDRAFT_297629 [Athelia psychrophila]|uniref:Uncharacterized protein n=1 Tax=Athelia psychrophila TaxID=1759441 RepID=A0A166QRK7_9AGAM|nr:hypothetical protein FIBSPDRAFT_297629 [Fibularhizoctonia sp. CBS 109695]